MNLEKAPVPGLPEKGVDIQKRIESIFGKSLRCFRRWGGVGVAVGAFFIGGEVAAQTPENTEAYKSHVAASMSSEQLEQKEANEAEIRYIFGNDAVLDINNADLAAFLERKKERREPVVSGFTGKNFSYDYNDLFTEKYGRYPKRWIDGEVSRIEFIDCIDDVENNLATLQTGIMGLYIDEEKISNKNKLPVDNGTIAHEFAHANDWSNDMDLNILDRQRQLLEVYNRLMELDAFKKGISLNYEPFLDGTKEGSLKAASEYWAEICEEYFINPKEFLKDHPKDFRLVDTYVKKNDPSFDVFNIGKKPF